MSEVKYTPTDVLAFLFRLFLCIELFLDKASYEGKIMIYSARVFVPEIPDLVYICDKLNVVLPGESSSFPGSRRIPPV